MRSCLFVLTLGLTLLSACKKDENNYYQYVPPYNVTGLTDLTLRKLSGTQKAYLVSSFSVSYNNGEQERVSVSLEGKPTGLYDSIAVKTGYPTFNSGLLLADSGVAEGEYTVKLVAQGDKSGRREYPFKVTVASAPECTAPFIGTYGKNSNCLSGTMLTQTVTLVPGVKNRLVFPDLNGSGLQLVADVNCDQGRQLTIPSQTVGGVTYTGSASVSSSSGTNITGIQLYIVSSTGNTCVYNLSR